MIKPRFYFRFYEWDRGKGEKKKLSAVSYRLSAISFQLNVISELDRMLRIDRMNGMVLGYPSHPEVSFLFIFSMETCKISA